MQIKVMTKKELFKKYSINESHNEWNNRIDNWISVEIYRIMHNGELPKPDDLSTKYMTVFLDNFNNTNMVFAREMMKRADWGSLYLTAKRQIYKFADEILTQN